MDSEESLNDSAVGKPTLHEREFGVCLKRFSPSSVRDEIPSKTCVRSNAGVVVASILENTKPERPSPQYELRGAQVSHTQKRSEHNELGIMPPAFFAVNLHRPHA